MTEYASLILAVDSTQAKTAATDVKELGKEGEATEGKMRGLGDAAAVVGTAMLGAATATAAMIAASVDAADAAGEAAQSAGMSTEEFTRLKYAMQFDGSPEALGQNMKFLNSAIVDASNGTGTGAKAFAELGVAVTNADGSLRDSRDVMLEVSDRFASMEDGAIKASLATDIFGKAGGDMIPFLNNGSEAIRGMEAEADRLGVTISDNTAKEAGRLSDTFAKMKSAGAGFANQVMVAMLPALNGLGDEMVAAAGNTNIMETAGKALVIILKSVMTAGVIVAAVVQNIGDKIGATAAAAVSAATGDFAGAWAIIKASASNTVDIVSGAMTRVDNLWTASADSVVADEKRKQEAIHATAQAVATPAIAKPAALAAAPAAVQDPAMVANEDAALAAAWQSHLERVAIEEAAAVEMDAILDANYASALEKQANYEASRLAMTKATAAANRDTVIGALGGIAGAFASHSKTMFKAQKVAAIAQGALAIKAGILNAIALPFPANLAAMAKVAGIGAGLMSDIKSLSDGGSGGGGGVSIPGGGSVGSVSAPSGGTSVGATGQVASPGAVAARQQVVDFRVSGIGPDVLVTGSVVKRMMEEMGERLADGARMGRVELVMNA